MLQWMHLGSGRGPLWLVSDRYRIGTSPECDIKVRAKGTPAVHAELDVAGDNLTLKPLADFKVFVEDRQIEAPTSLSVGQKVSIGDDIFEVLDPKRERKKTPASAVEEEPWSLKALNTALADKQFALQDDQVIGRAQECDISLAVVHLSRRHARLRVTEEGLELEDLGSANGTFINGKKVQKAVARAGDEIAFDTLVFRVAGPLPADQKLPARKSADSDLTTIRPAVDIAKLRQAEAKTPKPESARPKPRAPHKPTQAAQSEPATAASVPTSRGSPGIWVALSALVIGGAAAWWFLIR